MIECFNAAGRSVFNTGNHKFVEVQLSERKPSETKRHVEMIDICRIVQKEIRQGRQFINRDKTRWGSREGEEKGMAQRIDKEKGKRNRSSQSNPPVPWMFSRMKGRRGTQPER